MIDAKQIAESASSQKKKAPRKKAALKKTAHKKSVSTQKITGKTISKKHATVIKAAVKKIRRTVATSGERHRMIAEIAFLRAERRGFKGGDPVEDWLEAEQEVDSSITD